MEPPATGAAAPATTPPAPPPGALSPAAAAEKARAAAKAQPAPAAPAPAPAAPAAPAPGIKTEGASLADLTRLSSENRALQQKVKELEPHAADAKLLQEVRDLYKGGKKIEAIGKLAGADPTGEMEALLASYLAPDAAPEVGDKLAAKVDEIAKRIDDEQAARAAQEATAAEQAEHATKATGAVIAAIKARAAELPHLSKADGNAMVGKVVSALTALRHEKGHADPATMTPEITASLLAEALETVEIELEVRANREARKSANPGQASASPPAVATPAAAPAPTIDSLERPGVAVQPWGKTLSHSAAKEKLRALIRQGQ